MIQHALIFAAGRGERMQPLTATTPKPLISVFGKPLIEWHIEALARANVRHIVINTSHLAEQFFPALGDGKRWGIHIDYIYEGIEPLETGGGMLNALSLLQQDFFIAVNGDIWCDYDFSQLPENFEQQAHLVLVDNPAHHPCGDFGLRADHLLDADCNTKFTFSGIGVYKPTVLNGWDSICHIKEVNALPRFPLAPILIACMRQNKIRGEHYTGRWCDVGTLERLQDLHAIKQL